MKTTIYVILAVYLLFMLAVGVYGKKNATNFSDFLSAGQKGTLAMVACSSMASFIGSGFVVGGAENGATYGLWGCLFGIGAGLSFLLFALIARRIYRGGYLTVPDFLQERYNDKATPIIFAVFDMIALIGIIGGQIMAGQRLLSALGLEAVFSSVIITVVVIGYASLSGMWGVLMTDLVQTFITLGALVVVTILIVRNGGVSLLQTFPSDTYTPMTLQNAIGIVVPTALYGLVSQTNFQLVRASKNEKVAFKAMVLAGAILIPFAILPPFVGMYGKALFPTDPNGIVMFKMLLDVMPAVLSALMITGILAAIMSTTDSSLIAITAHATKDIYLKHINPNASEKHLFRISVGLTIVVGCAALFISLCFNTLISLSLFMYTVLISACFVPIVGGLIWKRGTAKGALASTCVGIPIILLHRVGVITLPHTVLVLIPCAVMYVIVSLLTKPAPPPEVVNSRTSGMA